MYDIASKIDLHENLEEQNCESARDEEDGHCRATEVPKLLGRFILVHLTDWSSIARSTLLSLFLLSFPRICSCAARILIVCIASVGVVSCFLVLVLRLSSASILIILS